MTKKKESKFIFKSQILNQKNYLKIHRKNIIKFLFFIFLGLFLLTLFLTKKRVFIKKPTSINSNISNLSDSKTLLTPSFPQKISDNWINYTSSNLGFSLKIPPNYSFKEKDTIIVISSKSSITDKYINLGKSSYKDTDINISFISTSDYNELLKSDVGIPHEQNLLLNNGNKAKLISSYDSNHDNFIHLIPIEHNNSILLFLLRYSTNTTQSIKDQLFSDFSKIAQSIEFIE